MKKHITWNDLLIIGFILIVIYSWFCPQNENPDGKDDMRRDKAYSRYF